MTSRFCPVLACLCSEQKRAAKEKDEEVAAVKEGLMRHIHELTAVISEQERELHKRAKS